MTNRANLIRLIHVARRALALDDDTYRVMIGRVVPGKTSCRDLKPAELERVLHATKRWMPLSSVPPALRTAALVLLAWHGCAASRLLSFWKA